MKTKKIQKIKKKYFTYPNLRFIIFIKQKLDPAFLCTMHIHVTF